MKKVLIAVLLLASMTSCAPLLIGAAAGGATAYVVSHRHHCFHYLDDVGIMRLHCY